MKFTRDCEMPAFDAIAIRFLLNLLTNEMGCKDVSVEVFYVPEPDIVGQQNLAEIRVLNPG